MNDSDTLNLAHESLMNWGRFVRDDPWLKTNLLYSVPPTSDQYVAPVVGFDDPEPPAAPIDEADGRLAEHTVVSIGCEPGCFDYFRVLVHWYTRLAFLDITQDERHQRLSKFMKCSFPAARRMMTDAKLLYWERKRVVDGLSKMVKKEDVRRWI